MKSMMDLAFSINLFDSSVFSSEFEASA